MAKKGIVMGIRDLKCNLHQHHQLACLAGMSTFSVVSLAECGMHLCGVFAARCWSIFMRILRLVKGKQLERHICTMPFSLLPGVKSFAVGLAELHCSLLTSLDRVSIASHCAF